MDHLTNDQLDQIEKVANASLEASEKTTSLAQLGKIFGAHQNYQNTVTPWVARQLVAEIRTLRAKNEAVRD